MTGAFLAKFALQRSDNQIHEAHEFLTVYFPRHLRELVASELLEIGRSKYQRIRENKRRISTMTESMVPARDHRNPAADVSSVDQPANSVGSFPLQSMDELSPNDAEKSFPAKEEEEGEEVQMPSQSADRQGERHPKAGPVADIIDPAPSPSQHTLKPSPSAPKNLAPPPPPKDISTYKAEIIPASASTAVPTTTGPAHIPPPPPPPPGLGIPPPPPPPSPPMGIAGSFNAATLPKKRVKNKLHWVELNRHELQNLDGETVWNGLDPTDIDLDIQKFEGMLVDALISVIHECRVVLY